MREQKKDRHPAKGNGLIIGNRNKYGDSNLMNVPGVHNPIDAIKLAQTKRTLISGLCTYKKVCKGLERNFLGVQNEN